MACGIATYDRNAHFTLTRNFPGTNNMSTSTKLFEPFKLGPLTLPNRLVMAPLTRSRAGAARVPNELMAQYYRQRASAGLIVSEATSVTPMGVGYSARNQATACGRRRAVRISRRNSGWPLPAVSPP